MVVRTVCVMQREGWGREAQYNTRRNNYYMIMFIVKFISTHQWSFGVTVWEIYTCGRIPYSGIHPMRLMKELQNGQRLEKPENAACHDEMLVYTCAV